MSLSLLNQPNMAIFLDNLFDESNKIKHLRTTPLNSKDPADLNYIMVDFQIWMTSILLLKKPLRHINYNSILSFNEECKDILMEISRNSKVSNGINLTDKMKKQLPKVLDMYIVFLKYIKKCQLRLFELYNKASSKNNPAPLIPFSFGLNRLADKLYSFQEKKLQLDQTVSTEITGSGNSNKYVITCYEDLKDFERGKDLNYGVILYNTDFSTSKTLDVSEDWLEVLKVFSNKQDLYNIRVALIQALYAQYIFTGKQKIKYLDGVEEEVFLLNYPFSVIEKNFGLSNSKSIKEVEFSII